VRHKPNHVATFVAHAGNVVDRTVGVHDVTQHDAIFVAKLRERFGLDVRTLTLVESLDLANKSVQLKHLPSQRSYTESFDKLLLATGAQPMRT